MALSPINCWSVDKNIAKSIMGRWVIANKKMAVILGLCRMSITSRSTTCKNRTDWVKEGVKKARMTTKLRLASSGGDVKIWDMPELNIAKAFSPHSQPVGSLCWSPNSIFCFILVCFIRLDNPISLNDIFYICQYSLHVFIQACGMKWPQLMIVFV